MPTEGQEDSEEMKDPVDRLFLIVAIIVVALTMTAIAVLACPPEGDGGDPDLNRLKNRQASAAVQAKAMTVAEVVSTVDRSDPRRPHNTCPACETELAALTPGAAVAVARTKTPRERPVCGRTTSREQLPAPEFEVGEWEG